MRKYSILLGFVVLFTGSGALASHHGWQMAEAYSNADGTLQFVEMISSTAGHNQLSCCYMVAGNATTRVDTPFRPSNLSTSATNGRSLLFATAGFEAAFGIAPDDIIPDNFLTITSGDVFYNDTLTWSSLPTDGISSLKKVGSGQEVSPATPKNFAGTEITLGATSDTTSPVLANLPAGDTEIASDDTISGSDSRITGILDSVTCSDDEDSNPTISFDTPAQFPVGMTTEVPVTCNDVSGNEDTNSILFTVTAFADTDGDGLGDDADRDDDNDGMPDRYEVVAGHDPLVNDGSEVGSNSDMTNLEVYLALPKAIQYLQTTTTSPNVARLHIINTSDNPQSFTGTIFSHSGAMLGGAYQSLGPEVPPKGRLVLDSSDFETIFGIAPWKGPAMVEVVGSDNFSLMSKLVSLSGLISNTNCVSENRVLNVEKYDPDSVTYVRLINTTENAMGSIRGTLYDSSGNIIGSAETELVSSLLPKQMVWINIHQFEQLFGDQWDGEAMLEVTDIEGLKLLNLNLINGETFFNFSCFERSNETETGRVYLQTSSTGQNISMTHIVNTSGTTQQFTATMYTREGDQIGSANQVLGSAASKGRVVVSTSDLEEIFQTPPWKGPSMLEVSGTDTFELMTKQTSSSGLVSNVNCVRQNQVHNIEGLDSADITYIRLINTGDSVISNVTGTLYSANGDVVGTPNQTILTSLAPKTQTFINRNNLIDLFDGATWNGEVMMEVESTNALRLLNLNFINSETFFNFSCYESSN